jgi:hypothetical protein
VASRRSIGFARRAVADDNRAAKAAQTAPTDAELAAYPFWRGQVKAADLAEVLGRLAHPGGAGGVAVMDNGMVTSLPVRGGRHVEMRAGAYRGRDEAAQALKEAMDRKTAAEDYQAKFGD